MRIFILILGLALFLECDMFFNFGYEKQYQTTITRAVGPTTLTGVRGTLPEPTPTDANAIWLAPNGSDANPGTEAQPKLTLSGAVAALDGAHPTVHIFRNSFVGDLEFTETGNVTLGTSENIQVEEGEKAKVTFDTGFKLIIDNGNINGLILRGSLQDAVVDGPGWVQNCDVKNSNDQDFSYAVTNPSFEDVNIEYSVLTGRICVDLIPANTTTPPIIRNNIFYNLDSPSGSWNNAMRIQLRPSAVVAWTGPCIIERNIFINWSDTIDYFVTGTHEADEYQFKSNLFFNVDYVVGSANGTIGPVSLVFDQNYLEEILTIFRDPDQFLNVTVSNSYELTVLLMQDRFSGLQGDPNGFRLQAVGKTTPDGSGRYFIDSPLVDIYDTGSGFEDGGPWDEDTVLISETFNESFGLEWPPTSVTVENTLVNPVSLNDVNGNLHTGFDKQRRKFIFTFGDTTHISNIQIRQLRRLLADKGVKKWEPLGEANNLFLPNGVSIGVFSSVDNSVEIISDAMVSGNWRGFWITIGVNDYYITDNDTTKLYLVDKTGAGFPSDGSVNFIIAFILVQNEPLPLNFKQNNFTEFLKGGSWRESPEEVRNYDFTIDGFTLVEVEDFEEDLDKVLS